MTGSATDLVRRWDAQQAAYIAQREARFEVITEVLLLAQEEPRRVLDLACGPGSTSERVLRRFPHVHVVAVDLDPVLLALAAEHLAPWSDRLTLVDADLTAPDWVDAVRDLDPAPFDAVVSTTALHWLRPEQLVRVYEQAYGLLAPGGVLLNGDHFRLDHRTPAAADWAACHDATTQDEAFGAGAESWDAWWRAVADHPVAGPLVAERDRRFADRSDPTPPTTVSFQLAALAQAGFAEVGTVWQLFDDYVVHGVRAGYR